MNDDITIEELVNWYLEYYHIEIWKDIPGFEGYYQSSNTGRFRSLDRMVKGSYGSMQPKKGRILEQPLDKDGYPVVCLTKDGKRAKSQQAHIFVALTWVPNPLNLPQVNHIDENKTNNNAANLEWCDCKYNINWGTGIKRRSELKKKPVNQYTLNGELIATHKSAKDIENILGISGTHISACCKGKRKSAGGYLWKYA